MDVHDRIVRRRTAREGHRIVVDRDPLSPVVHLPDPVGRGPIVEQLLDALEPAFDGESPADFAVVGPPGAGKSALVAALFDALNDHLGRQEGVIGTTTRAGSGDSVTWFVRIDARRVDSRFGFYRAMLTVVSSESVPKSGVGTDDLRERVEAHLESPARRVVVAIDHADEVGGLSSEDARALLEPFADRVSTVVIGRQVPEAWDGPVLEVPAYRRHELVDVLTERASTGLAAGVLDHESTRDLAAWAEGNAHHALAALFSAAILATDDDATGLERTHLERAIDDVPTDGVPVDCVLALPETRQRVLHGLLSLESTDRPIREVATELAAESQLTAGTITRFLYELADGGILERTPLPTDGGGRCPSAVEPRFPTIVFRALSSISR